MKKEEKKTLLKEYFDSVQDENVKKFMEECIDIIPEYWYSAPASSSGKYHPNYALGEGGLMRHTIALLRFFNRLVRNEIYGEMFTDKEADLMRVACLMHDSRKSGSQEDFEKSKYTKFDHPVLAAEAVRSIHTTNITEEEKELVASTIESHMGQWNTDQSGRCKIVLPKPSNKYQKFVHIVDYMAAMKGCEILFDGFVPERNTEETKHNNENATVETYIFTFGKYKGMKLIDVNEQHPDYIEWAKKTIDREPLITLLKQL